MRTSRKGITRQMTQIERRQARIRRIRSYLEQTHAQAVEHHDDSDLEPDAQTSMFEPKARYHIGKSQNNPEHIIPFVQKNERDPAIKVCSTHALIEAHSDWCSLSFRISYQG